MKIFGGTIDEGPIIGLLLFIFLIFIIISSRSSNGLPSMTMDEIYYRLDNNTCNAVSIDPLDRQSNDYGTLEECQSHIEEDICLEDGEILGTVEDVTYSYNYVDVLRLDKLSGGTTWAGHYDCDSYGETNAIMIKTTIKWVTDGYYDELLTLLHDNLPCTCF